MSTSIRTLLAAVIAASIFGTGGGVRTQNAPPSATRFVAGELLIEFQPWVDEGSKISARQLVGAALAARLRSAGDGHLERVRLTSGAVRAVNAAGLSPYSNGSGATAP